MTARRWFFLAFAAALLTSFGCGSDSNSGGGATGPAMSCADSGNAPANGVTLRCGALVNSATEQVDAVLGGPAAGNTTLRGLNFDVVYDATKLDFVPAANYASALFPNALIAVTSPTPGRVVVGIQQMGGDPDVSVASGQHVALSLSFTVHGPTFPAIPLTFQNSEATAPSVPITFNSGLMLAYQ